MSSWELGFSPIDLSQAQIEQIIKSLPRFHQKGNWGMDALLRDYFMRMDRGYIEALNKVLPYTDDDTQMAFNRIVMCLEKGELLVASWENFFTDLYSISLAAIVVRAASLIYDWILLNWPFDTGNYRNKVIASCTLGIVGDIIKVEWSTAGVLNTSGHDYTQYVERKTAIKARAEAAFPWFLEQAVTEVMSTI